MNEAYERAAQDIAAARRLTIEEARAAVALILDERHPFRDVIERYAEAVTAWLANRERSNPFESRRVATVPRRRITNVRTT